MPAKITSYTVSENGDSGSSSVRVSAVHPETDEPPMKQFSHLSKLLKEKWRRVSKGLHINNQDSRTSKLFDPVPTNVDPVGYWVAQEKK